MTMDKSALYRAKLRALVNRQWGEPPAEEQSFLHGAAARTGTRGWVLAEERAPRALGAAMAWASRADVEELHVLAEADVAGDLARRATAFVSPPTIWVAEGPLLSPASAAPPALPSLDRDVLTFTDIVVGAGADPVAELDTLVGEVLGLEVARVTRAEDGQPRLEVGVGRHDRWAQLEMHGEGNVLERLVNAVRVVREARVPGGSHPFAELAPERWLRRVLVAHPDLVGARELSAVATPVVRDNLRERSPAPAVGVDSEGEPLMVVCSVGIDPDLVPVAADSRAMHAPEARLVVAVPEGDNHWITGELCAALHRPAEVVSIGTGWRALSV